MIDIHNHLLPGIDDGAQNLEESLGLAQALVTNGVSHSLCTPHIHFGRFDNTIDQIRTALEQLKRALKEHAICLELGMAAEVRFDIEIMPAILQDKIPFLGSWEGRNVLLLELPHGEVPVGAERLIQWLLDYDIQPMIAHPERNKGLMRNPQLLHPFIDQGCLIQLTAGSVVGGFGQKAEELALSFIEQGFVTVIATDAHHIKRRPPLLKEARERVSQLFSDSLAQSLVNDNPWNISREHFS